MKIRVLLADSHLLFRHSLRLLINEQDDMEVIGEASNGRELEDKIKLHSPRVVVTEMFMPGTPVTDVCRRILRDYPSFNFVFVTGNCDADYFNEAIQAGANGYLLKNVSAEFFLSSVRNVVRGDKALSPEMVSVLVDQHCDAKRKFSGNPQAKALTEREREVTKLLAEGSTVKEIAFDLRLSIKTVEAHKFNLMRKLNIHNRSHLVRYAIEHKLVYMAPPAVLEAGVN